MLNVAQTSFVLTRTAAKSCNTVIAHTWALTRHTHKQGTTQIYDIHPGPLS